MSLQSTAEARIQNAKYIELQDQHLPDNQALASHCSCNQKRNQEAHANNPNPTQPTQCIQ